MAPDAQQPVMIVFYLTPTFSLLEFSLAVETLRLANQALGCPAYRWRIASQTGNQVSSSCGVPITTTSTVAEERRYLFNDLRPDMVCICSDDVTVGFAGKTFKSWLLECNIMDVAIGGIGSGSHILAELGILDGKTCSIHWKNVEGFARSFETTSVDPGIYQADEGIWTCAGGSATIDMMLYLVKQDFGEQIMRDVCDRAINLNARDGRTPQKLPFMSYAVD
ncbi:AraC family transcriptional regulator [Brucella cytisi]|uniref:AraC family transcriptional regulator n=1 Tax=Brucella cytisi TaxID=407152 RepID=UPI00313D24BB